MRRKQPLSKNSLKGELMVEEGLLSALTGALKCEEELFASLQANLKSFRHRGAEADGGVQTYEKEMCLGQIQFCEQRISSLRQAIERGENGLLGTCAQCGEQIEPERLKTLPDAVTCSKCANHAESTGRRVGKRVFNYRI